MASISFRSHPSQEAWENYALRQLTEEEIEPLEEHLLVCEQCRHTLEEVDEYVLLMKTGAAALLHAPLENKRKGFWRAIWPEAVLPRMAWATAAAVCLIIVAVFFNRQPQGPPVAVTLVSLRGGADMNAHAPSRRVLDLGLVAPDISSSTASLRVEIVDAGGKQIWSGQPQASSGKVEVELSKGLSKGLYWVRLYDGPDLAYEYALRAD